MYDVTLMDGNGHMLKQWNDTKGRSLTIVNQVPDFYNLRVVPRESFLAIPFLFSGIINIKKRKQP